MAGNPGLAHPKDFLKFQDGEFLLLEKKQETEACFVSEQPQKFYD